MVWFGLMFALGVPYLDRAFARAGPPPPPVTAMRQSSQPAVGTEETAGEAAVPAGPARLLVRPRAAPCGRLAGVRRCLLSLDPMLGWIALSVCIGCVPPLQAP